MTWASVIGIDLKALYNYAQAIETALSDNEIETVVYTAALSDLASQTNYDVFVQGLFASEYDALMHPEKK